jgi:hypothetical protein
MSSLAINEDVKRVTSFTSETTHRNSTMSQQLYSAPPRRKSVCIQLLLHLAAS